MADTHEHRVVKEFEALKAAIAGTDAFRLLCHCLWSLEFTQRIHIQTLYNRDTQFQYKFKVPIVTPELWNQQLAARTTL